MDKTSRKRIIFLIDSLGMGGAERLMISYLQHLDMSRFEPYVCALQIRSGNPIAADIERLGVPVDLLPVRRLRDPRNLFRVVRYLRQRRADLVHTQLEFSNVLGSMASRLIGIPSVCTLHTFFDPSWGKKSWRRHLAMWWALRHFCDRIIAVSEGTRQHHIEVGRLPPDRVVTLYNGIDLSGFVPLDEETRMAGRQALNIPLDAPVLITVAVLRPQKGIQYMIEAMPAILQAVPEARYLVVGSGEHETVLKEMVNTHGLTDRVIFTGVRRDIPLLLALSDVFVLPTLGEALPTVLAEAMAAGRPIIASAIGGVPEMIEDSVNGLLVPPASTDKLAEACIRLLRDPEQCRRLGCAGRQIVEERFNIERQVQLLCSLYDSLLTASQRLS
jgi:glycosyltransferase involved in cell wall biosynthesis